MVNDHNERISAVSSQDIPEAVRRVNSNRCVDFASNGSKSPMAFIGEGEQPSLSVVAPERTTLR